MRSTNSADRNRWLSNILNNLTIILFPTTNVSFIYPKYYTGSTIGIDCKGVKNWAEKLKKDL